MRPRHSAKSIASQRRGSDLTSLARGPATGAKTPRANSEKFFSAPHLPTGGAPRCRDARIRRAVDPPRIELVCRQRRVSVAGQRINDLQPGRDGGVIFRILAGMLERERGACQIVVDGLAIPGAGVVVIPE